MSGAASAPRAIPTMYFLLYPPFKGRKSHVSTSGRKIAAFRQYLLLPGFHQPSMSPGNNWQAIARDHDWQVAYGEVDFDSREDGLNKNLDTRFLMVRPIWCRRKSTVGIAPAGNPARAL